MAEPEIGTPGEHLSVSQKREERAIREETYKAMVQKLIGKKVKKDRQVLGRSFIRGTSEIVCRI